MGDSVDKTNDPPAATAAPVLPQEPPALRIAKKKKRGARTGYRAFLKRVLKQVKKLNRTHAVLGDRPHFDNAAFPWVPEVERNWREMRAELLAILPRKHEFPNFHDIVADVSTITDDDSWKTFFFCCYGKKSARNRQLCPKTWETLQRIPGMTTGMFSILEPGKHIPAHKGPYNGVLRLHLPLIIPEPREQTGIRVDDRVYHWREGEALIFDDAFEHEAWNATDGIRVVLFVDFRKPLRFPANVLNWLVLNLAPFVPFIQEGYQRQRRWEARFHAER